MFITNDVVAFVGGGDVAAAQHNGHLEALLALHHPGMGVRFRNFGWEGDTVFEQPRDYNFPSLPDNLQKAGTTVVVIQFGRGEALSGKRSVAEFRDACAKLLDQFAPKFRKLILVTPVPFEDPGGFLPALSKRNGLLAEHAQVIRELARERGLLLVDVFEEFTKYNPTPSIDASEGARPASVASAKARKDRLTLDGLQLNEAGHALVARAFARKAGVEGPPRFGGASSVEPAEFERVRRAVVEKNRLWFHYSRPQNWAFLGGDRVSQPSSRDHRDPKVRWFPAEMERFLPLIADAEKRIDDAVAKAVNP